jgi:hypothetical protein
MDPLARYGTAENNSEPDCAPSSFSERSADLREFADKIRFPWSVVPEATVQSARAAPLFPN